MLTMKSEVILNTYARKQLYFKHHVISSHPTEETMIESGPSDQHRRSPSLSPPDNSKDINRKSPLLSNGRSPSQSPDHLPFVPLNVDHMGLNGLKSTDIKVTYPSVITCGQPLGATNGDLYHRHGYPVGLGLPSSMDSPVVSPISVPVMNDSSRENSQCSPSPPMQETSALSVARQPSQPVVYDCHWLKCDKNFGSMDDLVTHVNDYHVKVERPDVDYQCKWNGCPRKGKGFNARYKMLIHIRTHTNEKPHSCKLCGKCFSRLENLKIHYRSHTGEKPYICPVEGCNKAYSNSSDRFKHVRTHQEEKPYICKMPGCNKRYTDPSSLRKHVRTHGHYYREEDEKNRNKAPVSLPQHQPVFPITKIQIPSSPMNPVMTMSPSKLVPHNMPPHIHPLHNVLHVSSFTSNPMLSSTILTQATQSISTQTEGVIVSVSPNSPLKVEISGEKYVTDDYDKSQDRPLDLSTSPSTESDILTGHREHSNFNAGKWELIHS